MYTRDCPSVRHIAAIYRLSQAQAEFVVPLELKTGKPNLSHNAQTLLYSLLLAERYGSGRDAEPRSRPRRIRLDMGDRYGGAVDMGLLVYLGKWLKQPTLTKEVPVNRAELVSIVQVMAGRRSCSVMPFHCVGGVVAIVPHGQL